MTTDETLAVNSWQPVQASVRDWMERVHSLKHFRTTRQSKQDHCARGGTLWSLNGRDGNVGVYFDWAELSPGVVALANPMGIVSNICLFTDSGHPLPWSQVVLCLNNAVFELPWQEIVCQKLREWRMHDRVYPVKRAPRRTKYGVGNLAYRIGQQQLSGAN